MCLSTERFSVKIETLKNVTWPCTVAVLKDGTEIPFIRRIDFHHVCDKVPVATIEVNCREIEADAEGILTTTFMGKTYRLVEET